MKKLNIDGLLEEKLKLKKERDADQKRAEEERKTREERERQARDAARKERIEEMLRNANANLVKLLGKKSGNDAFRSYFTTLLERRAFSRQGSMPLIPCLKKSRTKRKKRGVLNQWSPMKWKENHIEEFVLVVAREKDAKPPFNAVPRAVEIALVLEKQQFQEKVTTDVSAVRVEVINYSHDFGSGSSNYSRCTLYFDKSLDDALIELSSPESTVSFLVDKFGDLREKPVDNY